MASMQFCLVWYLYHIAHLGETKMSFLNLNLTNSFEEEELFENNEELIDNPGCTIPNVWKDHDIVEAFDCKNTCGKRAVDIQKLAYNDHIEYIINDDIMKQIFDGNAYKCCSQFAYRLPSDNMEYTLCMPFKNGTRERLQHEVITVTCNVTENSTWKNVSYEDAYILPKKMYIRTNKLRNNAWNVLILGMDTMSRARAVQSMPKLVKYFKQNGWLDYRGFQKAASNTFPNLMILHTGKKPSTFEEACKNGMNYCNDLMIWSKFKKSGFFTAYGEDRIPDAYTNHHQFRELPTDHYTRPLFLIGENKIGNIICLKRRQSAYHVLDYAYEFVRAYMDNRMFGFFWLLTYSHDPNQVPTLLQNQLIRFFNKLNNMGALNNTIIFFLGDHGVRFGPQKTPVASYYDERLPMLFMWFPNSFRVRHETEFHNLQLNQYRLTTHCDLHSTLWNILKLSDNNVKIIPPEFCPLCTSLFEEKSIYRRCEQMNVSARWCSCHALNEIRSNDIAATLVPEIFLDKLRNNLEKSDLEIKRILRHHWFRHEYDYKDNITYYLIAIELQQEAQRYEGIIKKNQFHFEVLGEVDQISPRDEVVDISHCRPTAHISFGGFSYV